MKYFLVILALTLGAPQSPAAPVSPLGARVSSPALISESPAGEDTRAPGEPAPGEVAPKTAAPTKDLVSAAKDSKSKRKKPSTKVLTNADVKKSKGTLIELKSPAGEQAVDPVVVPETSSLARQDEQRRVRIELEEKIASVQNAISGLERELELIEQRYYEENDPDRRDKLIRRQFEEKQKELEIAREELAALVPPSQ